MSFALPAQVAPLTQEINMGEADGFEPRETLVHVPYQGELRLRLRPSYRSEVRLLLVDGHLQVELFPAAWGMPRRHRRPPTVRLAYGEWLRWQINYRFMGMNGGASLYRLDTLNVAHGAVPASTFLGEPPRFIDERAHIW
ncbi:hypothetical protein [Micromonospora sp. NBC_01796]|uniref:hypothetical protein n=1 Tax=Micromonospora sp. NBC_01796 TaxID=2975987 RepID=UPI002DDAF94B|nr:hypothetical protein [Micromonospora sp. NBC_01796]WSA88663.1 hypothetical protein OIE47_14255 [Micromonospora sp. NBC_01796]